MSSLPLTALPAGPWLRLRTRSRPLLRPLHPPRSILPCPIPPRPRRNGLRPGRQAGRRGAPLDVVGPHHHVVLVRGVALALLTPRLYSGPDGQRGDRDQAQPHRVQHGNTPLGLCESLPAATRRLRPVLRL